VTKSAWGDVEARPSSLSSLTPAPAHAFIPPVLDPLAYAESPRASARSSRGRGSILRGARALLLRSRAHAPSVLRRLLSACSHAASSRHALSLTPPALGMLSHRLLVRAGCRTRSCGRRAGSRSSRATRRNSRRRRRRRLRLRRTPGGRASAARCIEMFAYVCPVRLTTRWVRHESASPSLDTRRLCESKMLR
jgi:hypothetical protein